MVVVIKEKSHLAACSTSSTSGLSGKFCRADYLQTYVGVEARQFLKQDKFAQPTLIALDIYITKILSFARYSCALDWVHRLQI